MWEVIRFTVFKELSTSLLGYSQAHNNKKEIKGKLFASTRLVFNSIYKNPLLGKYKVDYLVYDHERKINVEGNNIDIYTKDFLKSSDPSKFDVIEAPYLLKHISKVEKNRKYLDNEMLSVFIKKKLFKLRLTANERLLISEIQNGIKNRFKVNNLSFYEDITNYIESFLYKYQYHKKLLQKRKPRAIYVVVSYGKLPIIAAAKELGIQVIEFQHGVITAYHFAYNFGDPTKKIKYFPDKLLTFGNYWANTPRFPKQTEIEIYGFPYLNQQIEKYKKKPKKDKQVLFVSQGTIGKELSIHAKEIAEKMPDYHFIYKLHPGEYDRWRKAYPSLVEASHLGNIEIIDNNKKNLYNLFAESEFQIGVYSTAIFEGLTLNCKTILFNIMGIEYMNDIINKSIVEVASNADEAISHIKNYKLKEFARDYFFKE
ncbi:hypothetical protein [Oceanobacillus massiliensis]|uniref:hypothetical protein n=1 Tax=Oceanobacillus massiliensis TaxID=1465765 RepID=UPI0002891E14|nr:hypothetical protein [Oceanobacillus massiliensis]